MNAKLDIVNDILDIINGAGTVSALDENLDDVAMDVVKHLDKKHLKMQLLEGCRTNIVRLDLHKNELDNQFYVPSNVIKILTPRLLLSDGKLVENKYDHRFNTSYRGLYFSYDYGYSRLDNFDSISIWVKILTDYSMLSYSYRNALVDSVASQLMLLRSDTPRETYHTQEMGISMTTWLREELNYDPINILETEMYRRTNPNG